MNREWEFNKWKKNLVFSAATVQGENIWFFTEVSNILVKMNMRDWSFSFIQTYGKSTDQLISDCDNIYKLEQVGGKLLCISTTTLNCEVIDLGHDTERSWGNYAAMGKGAKYIYIYPTTYPAIIRLDIESKKVFKDCKLYASMGDRMRSSEGEYFQYGEVVGQDVLLFSKQANTIIRHNMENNLFEYYRYPSSMDEFVMACWSDNSLYLLFEEGRVFRWKLGGNRIELIWKQRVEYPREFGNMVVFSDKIFLLPSLGKRIFLIDRKKGISIEYAGMPEDFCYVSHPSWGKYLNRFEDNNTYYFPMRSANYLLCFDKVTGSERWIKPSSSYEKERFQYYVRQKACMEGCMYDLREWVQNIICH